jgi:hypothetical protein
MIWRPENERVGFVSVCFKDNSKKFVPRNEFDGIEQAIVEGRRFYRCLDLRGNSYLIVLDWVSDVCDYTAESIAGIDRDDDAAKAAELTQSAP